MSEDTPVPKRLTREKILAALGSQEDLPPEVVRQWEALAELWLIQHRQAGVAWNPDQWKDHVHLPAYDRFIADVLPQLPSFERSTPRPSSSAKRQKPLGSGRQPKYPLETDLRTPLLQAIADAAVGPYKSTQADVVAPLMGFNKPDALQYHLRNARKRWPPRDKWEWEELVRESKALHRWKL